MFFSFFLAAKELRNDKPINTAQISPITTSEICRKLFIIIMSASTKIA